jgi:hypothetical protein
MGVVMSRQRFLLSLTLAAALSGACAFTTRNIADIQQYPGRYAHRSVSVEGTVTSAFGVPGLPVQAYKVSDGTGEITVIANDVRGVPRTGSHVRVKGKVEEIASFGNRSFGLHMRQEHVTVNRGY